MVDLEAYMAQHIPERELRRLAVRSLNGARLALHKAIAHHAEPQNYPLPAHPRSVERLFLNRFRLLRPEARQASVDEVLPLVKKPRAERINMYGDLADVDLRSHVSVRAQVRSLPVPSHLKPAADQLQLHLSPHLKPQPIRVQPAAPKAGAVVTGSGPGYQAADLAELRIRRVQCLEDTKGLLEGKDDISLAGLNFNLCKGVTRIIPPFEVGEFKQGDELPFSPPRRFTAYPLRHGAEPVPFVATFVLADKDTGGLDAYLKDLHTVAEKEIVEELISVAAAGLLTAAGTALGIGIGAQIGGLLGAAIGGPLGALAGALVGILIGGIIYLFTDVLPQLLKDEIFPAVPVFQAVGPVRPKLSGDNAIRKG
jgi:hypothetical protein